MHCPSCQSELSSGLKTCPSCGTALIPQAQVSEANRAIQDAPAVDNYNLSQANMSTREETSAQHASPMIAEDSIQHAIASDESMPSIEDVSTNSYEIDHLAAEQTHLVNEVPTIGGQTVINDAIPIDAEGRATPSTSTNPDALALEAISETNSASAYTLPVQIPVPDESRTAPLSNSTPALARTKARGLTTSALLIMFLLVFAALLVIENGGMIVYGVVYLPAQTNAQATVAARPLATVHAQATDSAQQMATAQVQTTALAQQISQAQATADQQSNTIYTQSTNGIKVFDDPLNNPNTSLWSYEPFDGGSCAFSNGAYHAVAYGARGFVYCDLPMALKDFAFQVEMTITAGDGGGLLFHANTTTSQFYYLGMDAATGDYYLNAFEDNSSDHAQTLQSGFMPTFKTGNNQTNLVTIIAKGSNIYLYINKQLVFNVVNNKYTNGIVSLIADDHTKNTDVAFTNAQLWLLLN